MGSFFVRWRGNASSGPAVVVHPPKRDHGASVTTPLEKMLRNPGPLRSDGSDKFFGMENYGNTCYCNSILQCLYYSVPFRESVINYPKRSPIEVLHTALANNLRYPNPDAPPDGDAQLVQKQRTVSGNPSVRSAGVPPNQSPKVEDKDSPEYKKKVAMNTLPLLETTDNAASYGMKESLFTSLKDIFEAVVASQSRVGVIRPYQFLEVLRREHEMFRTAMHQDAHEFLNLLLNEVVANVEAESKRMQIDIDEQSESGDLSEQATTTTGTTVTESVSAMPLASNGSKSPNTTRWVHELFEGTLTSETQCLTCENVSQRDEVFLDLSVDLDQHSSVTSCLRKFSEEEMLCERNKFHCDNCGGLQEAEKRMKIKRLPRILALHLKRFKYTEDLQRLQKLFHRVVYPYYLRLFNTTDDAEDPDRLYELYAVVVHIGGGPYHGHYVAIIKTEDRGWLLFDDEMVEPVDTNYVRNFFGDRPGLACAYVLFYQETTFEAMQREQEGEGIAPARQSSDVKDPAGPVHKMNGFPTTPDMSRVLDSSQSPPLKASPTALELSTNYENAISTTSPSTTPPSVPPAASTVPPKSDAVQTKKERAKEEKERKAAEKEKEKAEKQKRRDGEAKVKEAHKRRDAESKAALEVAKASKVEDDRRPSSAVRNGKENGFHGGLSGSLSRFKLGSKSLNYHHRPFVKDKEREPRVPEIPPLPGQTSPSDFLADKEQDRREEKQEQTAEEGPKDAIPALHEEVPDPGKDIHALPLHNHNQEQSERPAKHATPKRSRFSLRKKSLSVL